jgi:hypothetical protein
MAALDEVVCTITAIMIPILVPVAVEQQSSSGGNTIESERRCKQLFAMCVLKCVMMRWIMRDALDR